MNPLLSAIVFLSLVTITWGDDPSSAESLIGYTEHSTNLPGGRHANVITNPAMIVKADGTERKSVGTDLLNEAEAWTQFAAGWCHRDARWATRFDQGTPFETEAAALVYRRGNLARMTAALTDLH